MAAIDWVGWHRAYEDPGSWLSQRLRVVQDAIREFLASRPGETFRVLSICAGQAHDLLGVLESGDDGDRVRARLVEIDARNVELGTTRAAQARLTGVEFVCGDASCTDAYAGAVPADLVLLCGVFGRISDDDVRNIIDCLPQLCARSARIIWTRHRREPDLTPAIRGWLSDASFSELRFASPGPGRFAVGVHEFTGSVEPLVPGRRIFTYIG